MTPSSSALPSARPSLYAFLLGENDRENCARRGAAVVPTKVSLKNSWDTTIGDGEKEEGNPRSLRRRRRRRLRSSGPSHRNCRRSPTRNLARRKYGLMSSTSFFSHRFSFFPPRRDRRSLSSLESRMRRRCRAHLHLSILCAARIFREANRTSLTNRAATRDELIKS